MKGKIANLFGARDAAIVFVPQIKPNNAGIRGELPGRPGIDKATVFVPPGLCDILLQPIVQAETSARGLRRAAHPGFLGTFTLVCPQTVLLQRALLPHVHHLHEISGCSDGRKRSSRIMFV